MVEQAEVAFQRISDLYQVPKTPEDVQKLYDNEEHATEVPSVYQLLGLLKSVQPHEDPRGRVLLAIYYVKNGYDISIDEVLKEVFGKKARDYQGIGFKGENSYVEIVFIKPGESWFEMGCKLFISSQAAG